MALKGHGYKPPITCIIGQSIVFFIYPSDEIKNCLCICRTVCFIKHVYTQISELLDYLLVNVIIRNFLKSCLIWKISKTGFLLEFHSRIEYHLCSLSEHIFCEIICRMICGSHSWESKTKINKQDIPNVPINYVW